jgi:cytidylate kinase
VSKKINIAIDGYSSCGKSTLAKTLASELNYIYIDTGAMYRAVTLYALQRGYIKNDVFKVNSLVQSLDNIYITFKYNIDSQTSETYLNGVNVEKEIRSMQVSNNVSKVADVKEVRAKLVRLQKRMAESRGVVMDGRDIGTVVIPDAELKLFMTASPEVRAKRRFDELKANGVEVGYEEVFENINMRDHIDSHRSADPLRRAEDAIVIDNSELTMEEQFLFAMNHVNRILNERQSKAVADKG